MQAQRTREEIENLKIDWKEDPIWDIETTEGFEEHHDELLAYRLRCEEDWRRRREAQLEQKAAEMGVPGNLTLARYIERLETKIAQLEDEIDSIRGE